MTDSLRTLVIGVDYSDQSIFAVDEALRIASTAPGTRLVPTLILPRNNAEGGGAADAVEATRALVERSIENLQQLLDTRARALGFSRGSVEPRVRFGVPADELTTLARELGAQLISVGTHARRGLSHLLLGSVAEEVLKKASCSVLIARAPEQSDDLDAAASEPGARARSLEPALPGSGPGSAGAGSAGAGSFDTARQGVASPIPSREDAALEDSPLDDSPLDDSPLDDSGVEGAEPTVVAAPHIDGGLVVLHVLDAPSGQVFLCAFEDEASVSVEPLEGSWVPAPSSGARARVARIALRYAGREPGLFAELLGEIARRRAQAGKTL